jgi:hypothetical protein
VCGRDEVKEGLMRDDEDKVTGISVRNEGVFLSITEQANSNKENLFSLSTHTT